MWESSDLLSAVPRLAAGAYIESDAEAEMLILHHQGGEIALNREAAALLQLCDGLRTRREILFHFARHDRAQLQYINSFLDAACKRGWITESLAVRSSVALA